MQDSDADFDCTSPDYCTTCGNLEFAFWGFGAWCSWCHPAPSRPVKMPTESEVRNSKTKSLGPVPYGDPITPTSRMSTGFFTVYQVLAAWPEGWEPPHPCGTAASAIAMKARQARRGEK